MKNRRRLANVANREGRLDVLLYQIVSHAAERLEREQGLTGIREHLLPIVEDVILAHVPAGNLIPREITALIKVCELNRARLS